jgi:hypothetical protein
MREYLQAMEQRLTDRIEHVETALLTEFHKWASPADARMRSHSATLRALDLEMEYLAEKLRKLEEKQGGTGLEAQ